MPVIAKWTPEDRAVRSHRAARRNRGLSVLALGLAFAVWTLWSVLVVQLPAAGFHYSTNQLFWLTALPALCAATLRIFHALALPVLGGRRFTALATASLLLPALGIGFAVQDTRTPYELMVVLALLSGVGSSNLANALVPTRLDRAGSRKGLALGISAGLGQLGVAIVQWGTPLVIAVGLFGALGGAPQASLHGPQWLQNAGFVWVPLLAAAALAAWFGIDDHAEARAGFAEQAVIFTRKHNWLMCWLYLGSFGSFIGFAAGLPLLLQSQFPQAEAGQVIWLGPLLGALMRPAGGWLADRWGGARVSFWSFVMLALGAGLVLQCLPVAGQGGSLTGFLSGFGGLFAAAGLASGSIFHLIESIFPAERQRAASALPSAQARATQDGELEAAAVLGFVSAIGAYGGFFIPKSLGTALALTGSPAAALWVFFAFYVSCVGITWWQYSRRHAPMPC